MPAGTVIGRISVKVLPDTDDFRKTAQRDLDVIERELKAQVQLELDLSKESLDKATQDLDHWARKTSPVKVDGKLNLSEANLRDAQTRLAILARDRTVSLIPTVNKAAATRVQATLFGLSGARVIGSYFDDIAESIGRLDKSTPKIAALSLATAGLAGWGLSAAANLASLSASLAQIGPAALALPGIFGGLAIGLVASAAALKDFNKQVPAFAIGFGKKTTAGSAWKQLQDIMSAKFWNQAKAPISDFISTIFPQFSKGIIGISTQLGGFFGGLASSLKGAFNGELQSMFDALGKSIDIFKGATPAIANIAKVLGNLGAGLLPQLAGWVADIATQFSNFLGKAAKDGSLQRWVNDGVTALKQLGSVITGLGGILAGIGKAAAAGGGSTLGTFANTLHAISDAVNTPAFQTGLVTVLQAAFDAMSRIGTQAGPAVSSLFQTLAQMLTSILPQVGQTIGLVVSTVANALTQPAVQSGIQAMFQGIAAGIAALAPAVPPVAQALGALMQVIGTLATTLGPTLAAFFTQLAAAAIALAPTVQALIVALGPSLAGAMKTLIPPLVSIIKFFLQLITPLAQNQTLVTVFAASLLGLVTASKGISGIKKAFDFAGDIEKGVKQIGLFASGFRDARAAESAFSGAAGTAGGVLRSLANSAVEGVKGIGSIVKTMAIGAAEFAANAARVVASMAVTVASTIAGWIAMAAQAVASAAIMAAQWLIAFGPIILIGAAIVALVVLVIKNWDTIKAATVAAWGAISAAVVAVWDFIKSVVVAAADFLVQVFLTWTLPGIIISHWDTIKAAAVAVWNGLKALISAVADGIVAFFKNWTLPGIILTHWNSIKSAATSIWNAITSFISGIPGKILAFFGAAWRLDQVFGEKIRAVYTAAVDKFGDVVSFVKGIPGKIISALGDLSHTLYSAGTKLIQGLIDGIGAMFDKVKGKLGDLTGKLTSWKGPPAKDATLLFDAGQLVIDGFINGLESRYDAVKRSLQGLSDDVANTTLAAPQMGDFKGSSGVTAAVNAGASTGGASVTKVLNYYAAEGPSLDSDEALFDAMDRARAVSF